MAAATLKPRPWVKIAQTTFFSGVAAGTAGLSYWQLQRRQWKLALVSEREATLHAAPEPLAAVVPAAARADGVAPEHEFRRVECRGTFDHRQQLLMGPRSAPAGVDAAPPGAKPPPGGAGMTGWDVITPLRCTDGGAVLVNRGWVPRDQVDQVSQPVGELCVDGVLRCGEAGNRFTTNDAAQRRFVYLDAEAMADATGSSPVVLYETPSQRPSPGGGGWPLQRPLSSFLEFHVKPETHLVYSATWASLSGLMALMTAIRLRR